MTEIHLVAVSYPTVPWQPCGLSPCVPRVSAFRRVPCHPSSHHAAQVPLQMHAALLPLGRPSRSYQKVSLSGQASQLADISTCCFPRVIHMHLIVVILERSSIMRAWKCVNIRPSEPVDVSVVDPR